MAETVIRRESIAVVIPAYKVAPYIKSVISEIPEMVERIIVVDDASPDETEKIVKGINDPRVQYIRHDTNQGVGAAVITGFKYAIELGSTILVKLDGDGQMDPKLLPAVIEPVLNGEADIAKGNRFADLIAIKKMPYLRRMGNLTLSFLAKLSTGSWRTFDPTNGYFAVDASVFNSLKYEYLYRRYFFEISLLFAINMQRAVIVNVPMPACYGDEPSSLSIGRTLFEFPWLLMKMFFRRIWLQYFVLDFSVSSLFIISGIFLGVFGILWGLVAWYQSIKSGVVASTGTVMIAVLPCILGFQLMIQTIVMDVLQLPSHPISKKWRGRRRRNEIKDDEY